MNHFAAKVLSDRDIEDSKMRPSATRMILGSALLGATLMAGAIAMTGAADAKPVKHPHTARATSQVHARVMTRDALPGRERSFLDPGPVSSSTYGNDQAYMTANTYFNTTADQNFARSKFGNEALPRPLEVPGYDRPVFRFDSPIYSY